MRERRARHLDQPCQASRDPSEQEADVRTLACHPGGHIQPAKRGPWALFSTFSPLNVVSAP